MRTKFLKKNAVAWFSNDGCIPPGSVLPWRHIYTRRSVEFELDSWTSFELELSEPYEATEGADEVFADVDSVGIVASLENH